MEGTITVCDDETCTIDGKRVSLESVARIELQPGLKSSQPVTAGSIVLTDGSVQTGRFVGLSLGVVVTDATEFNRKGVAAIVLDAAPVRDVAILRDGSTAVGSISTCNAASCTVDGRTVPLASMVWLGLRQEGETPPAATDADLIFENDAAPVPARLSGLDATMVRTTRGSFARERVSWIRLAAAASETSPGGPIYRDQPDAAPPSTPQPPLPPPVAPPSTNAPPVQPPVPSSGESLPRGRLWVGELIGRLWTLDGSRSLDVSADVRLREYTRAITTRPPSSKKVAEIVFLLEEGTLVKNAERSRSGDESCRGNGETMVNHAPAGAWSSAIYRRTSSLPMPPPMFEIQRDSPIYMLAITPARDSVPMFPITCVNPRESRTFDMPYIVPMAGTLPPGTVSFDTQIRHFDNGRMIGSYDGDAGSGFDRAAVSWAVCLEGTACPPPAPLDPDTAGGTAGETPAPPDPCARAGQQQAFADTCRMQLDAAVQALDPLFAEYNDIMEDVEANRQAFADVQVYCELYDQARQLLEAIITGGTGPTAEAARGLLHLRNLIEKYQAGDLPSLLYPKEVKNVLDTYKQAKKIWFELTADEVAKMRRDVNACSGKAPVETYMKAKKFVEDTARAREYWNSSVAPAINNVRGKGQECASRNHEAWRACHQDAQCRGEAPNCGPEPTLEGAYDEP